MDGFLKQFQKGVEQVASTAQKGAHEFQIKNALHGLQEERTKRLAALGARFLELREQEAVSRADVQAELAAIDDVDAQIAAKHKELDDLNAPPAS